MKRWYPRLVFCVSLICLAISPISAQYLGTDTEPPRLRDLEPMVVQIIYVIWGLGTLGLTLILMAIGFRYMTSMGDAQKQQQIREGATNWIVSLLIFFLAYPVILGVYEVTGISSSVKCYEDIATPGFKFFFPTVCTDPQASSDKYGVDADCTGFTKEELTALYNRGNCCANSGALIHQSVPIGKQIKVVNASTVVVFKSTTGACSSYSIACTIDPTDPDACKPDYEIVSDGAGSYKLIKYEVPTTTP